MRADTTYCAGDEVRGCCCTYDPGQLCCKFTWSNKSTGARKIDEEDAYRSRDVLSGMNGRSEVWRGARSRPINSCKSAIYAAGLVLQYPSNLPALDPEEWPTSS